MISHDSMKVIMFAGDYHQGHGGGQLAEEKIVGGRTKGLFRVVHVMETIDGRPAGRRRRWPTEKNADMPVHLKGERERMKVIERGVGGSIV